jgi:predicted  nucleic acid-binding Zn-ribbon protein
LPYYNRRGGADHGRSWKDPQGRCAVHAKVKLLEELQGIDLKIDGRQAEKDALLQQIAGLDRELEGSRLAVDALREELAALQAQKEETEQTLVVEADNIVRSEARLHDIKTQKEYQAVLKEISTAKKINADLEEQILKMIGDTEALQGSIAEGEQNLAALAGNIALRKGEVQQQLDSLEVGIASDQSVRDATTAGLGAPLIKRYTMLREKRQGIAVVEARDGSCLGCNMNIPPQMYNNLYKGLELITCPHCQRMLFIRQEETAA